VLHMSWSLRFNDPAADCATAGVARVGLRAWNDAGPFVTWSCEIGEGTTAIPSSKLGMAPVALKGAGVPLAYYSLNGEKWDQPGVYELAITFHLSDDPVPQLRRLFESVAAWYQSHGDAFPPAGDWTPYGPGFCCGSGTWDAICPADPKRWASPPWSDLGFSI